jgi:hypothetical protein
LSSCRLHIRGYIFLFQCAVKFSSPEATFPYGTPALRNLLWKLWVIFNSRLFNTMKNAFIIDGIFQRLHGTESSLAMIPRNEIVFSNDAKEGSHPWQWLYERKSSSAMIPRKEIVLSFDSTKEIVLRNDSIEESHT